ASFVGENNRFPGRVMAVNGRQAQIDTDFGRLTGLNPRLLAVGDEAFAFVRPERLRLTPPRSEASNTIESTVLGQLFQGVQVNVTLVNPHGRRVTVTMSNDGETPSFGTDSSLRVHFAADSTRILPKAELAHE